jgi:hypothetical protein
MLALRAGVPYAGVPYKGTGGGIVATVLSQWNFAECDPGRTEI